MNTTVTELAVNSLKFGTFLKNLPKYEIKQDVLPDDPEVVTVDTCIARVVQADFPLCQ